MEGHQVMCANAQLSYENPKKNPTTFEFTLIIN